MSASLCGRGLPVLNRIMGRMRNMAVDPDGRRFWPSFPALVWLEVAPLRRIQLVQHTPAAIEILYVMDRALDSEEERRLRANLRGVLGYPFELRFTRVQAIERRPGDTQARRGSSPADGGATGAKAGPLVIQILVSVRQGAS